MDTNEYFVRLHPKIKKEDFHSLPPTLIEDYENFFKLILQESPYDLLGELDGHVLRRPPLIDFRTIDIKLAGICYRLVYRIVEKTKTVEVFSFDHHDAAYDKAEERVSRTTGYRIS